MKRVILSEAKNLRSFSLFGLQDDTILKSLFLISVLCLLCSGCIRLAGGAGYYTEKDGEYQSKQASFDTERLNPNRPAGSITVGENS